MFVVWWAVSLVVSSTFRGLKPQARVFWALALVRAVFGGLFAPLGVYCGFVGMRDGSIVSVSSPLSTWLICNAIGFFVFECFALFASNIVFAQFDLLLFIHHVISLGGFSAILYTGHLHYFGVLGLILECSTPFTALSWISWRMGYETTTLWRANQILMVHMFHGRSFIEAFVWIQTFRYWHQLSTELSWLSILAFYPSLALMSFLLTPSWLLKKTRQLNNKPITREQAWRAIWDPDMQKPASVPVAKVEPKDKRRLKTM